MDEYKVSYIAWNLSNKNESSAIIKNSSAKTSGFIDSDLSDSGKWLKSMLGENIVTTPTPETTTNTSNSNTSETDSAVTNSFVGDLIDDFIVKDTIKPTIKLDSSWEESGKTCYLYSISLKNTTSKAISNWSLKLELNNNVQISDYWNCNAKVKQNLITITPADYNQTIQPDSGVSDIGIIVKIK